MLPASTGPNSAGVTSPDRSTRSGDRGGSGVLVEAVGISKAFFGVAANDDVAFDLRAGEVHALLGENGAGKSTLCSIIAGLYRADAGSLLVDGRPCSFRSPRDALKAGIGMVYQHYRLVERFTVAENMFLAHHELGVRVSQRQIERRAGEVMEEHGLHVDPKRRVGHLSVGEQQRVEILSLLARGVRVLILDEPTAVLPPQEAEALFTTMRRLADQGRGLIFVSHKMNEVFSVCDRITVLRDGDRVGCLAVGETDHRSVARLMVDRAREAAPAAGWREAADADAAAIDPGRVALAVRGLRVRDSRGHEAVCGLDLDVHAGELVGVAGVAGNGQRELADTIAGIRPAAAGSIAVGDEDVTHARVRARSRLGLAYVPEDRLAMGVAAGLSLEENLVLRSFRSRELGRGPFLSQRRVRRRAQTMTERFDIRGVRPGLPVRALSGGNLQRAILGRELTGTPSIVVAAAPTRGLDVAATAAVRGMLRDQCRRGAGVLLISEDLEELIEVADRVVVLYAGRIVGDVPADASQVERIGLLMAGSA